MYLIFHDVRRWIKTEDRARRISMGQIKSAKRTVERFARSSMRLELNEKQKERDTVLSIINKSSHPLEFPSNETQRGRKSLKYPVLNYYSLSSNLSTRRNSSFPVEISAEISGTIRATSVIRYNFNEKTSGRLTKWLLDVERWFSMNPKVTVNTRN